MNPLRRVREVPMSSSAYLTWQARKARRRLAPISLPTPTEVEAGLRMILGRPYWRDTVEAACEGAVADEVDAAYLAAIRIAPRKVGTAAGHVPMEVAGRLFEAGLIRKVK